MSDKNQNYKNVLVSRLSAFGDVAISVRLIHALIEQNPDLQIIFVTRKFFCNLFEGIDRIVCINPDLYGKHKGIIGIFRLFKEINSQYKIHAYADIHDVLRTKNLRLLYKLKGVKTVKIDKGRSEKKELVRPENKNFKQLKSSFQRYVDVFSKLNLKLDLEKISYHFPENLSEKVQNLLSENKKKIGIAPFALHKQKMYPLEKMKDLINILTVNDYQIFLFGGGEKEKAITESIENENKNVISLIGKLSLSEEITIIGKMNAMITMDSANMHISALTNTPIVSIWGATHPFAGFSAYSPKAKNIKIQISEKELTCRPCSVFGNKKCFRNDLACFNIEPQFIANKIIDTISSKNKR